MYVQLLTLSSSYSSFISATKIGAIVAGQTSVKAPERDAFEKHLPSDVHIVSCHSLHGPTVSPIGQPLVSSASTACITQPSHVLSGYHQPQSTR